jgi:hypothetical protein
MVLAGRPGCAFEELERAMTMTMTMVVVIVGFEEAVAQMEAYTLQSQFPFPSSVRMAKDRKMTLPFASDESHN